MKLPPFDYKERRWDQYKKFYTWNFPFVQTEDGELLLISDGDRDPHVRLKYPQYNLTLASVTDSRCPALYAPGSTDPIPTSWLARTDAQLLLIDHDHKRAVSADFTRTNRPITVRPKFADAALVYYASKESLPHTYHKIVVQPPHPRRKEYKVWREELDKLAKVTSEVVNAGKQFRVGFIYCSLYDRFTSGLSPAEVVQELAQKQPTQLSALAYATLSFPVEKFYDTQMYDYLEIR